MYERYTDRARKILAFANQEAQRHCNEYIGTEHLLIALVREGSGVAATALKNLDIDLRKVRLETDKLIKNGPDQVIMGKLPQNAHAKKCLEYAAEESVVLKNNYVGTEHLLLGLLREKDGIAAQVLQQFTTLEKVREEVMNLLGPVQSEEPDPKKYKFVQDDKVVVKVSEFYIGDGIVIGWIGTMPISISPFILEEQYIVNITDGSLPNRNYPFTALVVFESSLRKL